MQQKNHTFENKFITFLGNPGICGAVHKQLILQPILRLAQEFILIFAGALVQIIFYSIRSLSSVQIRLNQSAGLFNCFQPILIIQLFVVR